MIILRSITDNFDLLLGSQYMQFSLAVAYFVTLILRDWQAVHFEPKNEYWVKFDDETLHLEKVLFGLHLAYGIIVKFHEISPVDNNLTTGLCLGAILIEATDLIQRRIFYNPREWDEMTPDQERAVQMSFIEMLSYGSVIGSCALYTFLRVIFKSKLG